MNPLLTRPAAWLPALLTALLIIYAPVARAQAPAWAWGLQTTNPAPTDGSPAGGSAVAVDATGRAYVGGAYGLSAFSTATASRRFGSVGTVGVSRGGFVAQASAAGAWGWVTDVQPVGSNAFGGSGALVTGVAVSTAGEVYAAGTVQGVSVRVGTVTQAIGGSGKGLFVAKLSAAGVCQWVQVVAATVTSPALAADVSTGGVVLAGSYTGALRFGTATLPTGLASANGALYVARLSAAGTWLAAQSANGTAGTLAPVKVAVGPTGQVAVATSQQGGTLVFGTTTLTVPTSADEAFVIAQLSPTNAWAWAKGGSGSLTSRTAVVAYTPAGTLWAGGAGANGTVVGPLTLVAPSAGTVAGQAGFAALLSPTGQWTLARALLPTGSGQLTIPSLTVDNTGAAVLLAAAKGFTSTAQLVLGSTSLPVPTTGLLLVVAGLNAAGTWRSIAPVPAPALANGLFPGAIAYDRGSSLYFIGSLSGRLTLGSSALTGSTLNSSFNGTWGDAVLGRLANVNALPTTTPAPRPAATFSPNPAHGTTTLRLPVPAPVAQALTLLNTLGHSARTFAVPAFASEATLDLAGLPAGLYLLRGPGLLGRVVVE